MDWMPEMSARHRDKPWLYHWAFSKDYNHPHSPKDFEMVIPRRGDDGGHDTEHKSDCHQHDHWHGHHHHDHTLHSHEHHHDH